MKKDIELNPLSKEQRKLLQIGVVLLLIFFLVGYFLFISKAKNTSVYLQNEKLQIFDDEVPFTYPDKLRVSYPYLMVIKPEEQQTQIYNIETKKREKDIKQTVLDHTGSKSLYNEGTSTYLDKNRLAVLCEAGVIKSETNVLCVANSKLLNIDIKTKKQQVLYLSKYIITDLNLINNEYYLGEVDPETKKSYIVRNGKEFSVPNVVNIIYELHGKPHFASLKGALNPNTESYYEIQDGQAILQEDDKVVFYK